MSDWQVGNSMDPGLGSRANFDPTVGEELHILQVEDSGLGEPNVHELDIEGNLSPVTSAIATRDFERLHVAEAHFGSPRFLHRMHLEAPKSDSGSLAVRQVGLGGPIL